MANARQKCFVFLVVGISPPQAREVVHLQFLINFSYFVVVQLEENSKHYEENMMLFLKKFAEQRCLDYFFEVLGMEPRQMLYLNHPQPQPL